MYVAGAACFLEKASWSRTYRVLWIQGCRDEVQGHREKRKPNNFPQPSDFQSRK
ncbi:hypothetical protein LEMLEM_LOCUS5182 [Lemmus lemmus]